MRTLRNLVYVAFLAVCVLDATSSLAQIVPVPAAPVVYAVRNVGIHAAADGRSPLIGSIPPGRPAQITGVLVRRHWFQLTTGGFVSAREMSRSPLVIRHHHHHHVHPQPVVVEPPPVAYYQR